MESVDFPLLSLVGWQSLEGSNDAQRDGRQKARERAVRSKTVDNHRLHCMLMCPRYLHSLLRRPVLSFRGPLCPGHYLMQDEAPVSVVGEKSDKPTTYSRNSHSKDVEDHTKEESISRFDSAHNLTSTVTIRATQVCLSSGHMFSMQAHCP